MELIPRRSPRRGQLVPLLAGLVIAAVAMPPAQSLAVDGSWDFVASPASPEGGSVLSAVGALGGADAWAVGNVYTKDEINGILYDATHSFTLHWDGAAWGIVPSPNPSSIPHQNLLSAVAAISPGDVWAVGSCNDTVGTGGAVSQTLALHWDGSAWSRVPSPRIVLASLSGGSSFDAVSALATDDVWAAGMRAMGAPDPDEAPLAAHWNGSAWDTVTAPFVGNRINRFHGVSARTTSDVWAVGVWRSLSTTFHILIEHWNGSSWSVSPAADPGINDQLNAVVALAADDVWAAGERYDAVAGSQPLLMHWNGSAWSTIPLEAMPGDFHRLNAIGAVSPTDIWASGAEAVVSGGPSELLLMHWDGNQWTKVQAAPGSGSSPYFRGLAVVGDGEIWAVGSELAGGEVVPLTERFTVPGTVGVGGPPAGRLTGIHLTPNPTRGPVDVSFPLAGVTAASAAVFDLHGRLVRSLGKPIVNHEEARVRWDGLDDSGRGVAAGIYLLRIEAGGRPLQSKIVRVP